MDIHENVTWKNLKKDIETSVDKILNNHSELFEDKIDTIVENITNSKEIELIKRKFFDHCEFTESSKQYFIEHLNNPDEYNETKLENIFHQIAQSRSPDNKNKALQVLLKYPVVDLIDKWPKLSKILRDALLSRNNDIFASSYKIHLKLSSHPQAVIKATINVFKVLFTIFQSRKMCSHVNSIDLKISIHEQIMKMVNLLLNNFRTIFLNNTKENYTEDLINYFLELSIIHLSYDRTDYIHFLYFVYVLDPKAKWFQQLMHNLLNRKIIMNFCINKNAFFKHIIKEIINYVRIDNDNHPKKSWKTEITMETIKYAGFQHCLNIFSSLLSVKWCNKLFPIEIKSNEMNLQKLIIFLITSAQTLSNYPNQKYKQTILTESLKTVLVNNPHLLYNKNVIEALSKPFMLKINEKQKLIDIAQQNIYVLQTINEICESQEASFIIFGFSGENHSRKYKRNKCQYIRSISLQEPYVISTFIEKFVKQKNYSASNHSYISLGKVIVNFTANIIRTHIIYYEKSSGIDEIIYDLLECCCNIHLLHSHVINLVNSHKLLQTTLNLYKILIDHDLIINSMNSLLKFLMVICETKYGTNMFLKEDSELLYILCKHYFFIFDDTSNNLRNFSMFFMNLASTIPGCIAITECKKQIISPYLNKIWRIYEDELMYLSGSDKLLDEEIFKYLRFVFILHFNFNCVQTLLSDETDDESTLVDADEKPINLKDLIDEALSVSGPGTLISYIGLYTIRILINNLNNLIFMENAINLKKQMHSLQSECTINSTEKTPCESESSIIIDECSLLRRNIVEFILNIGVIKSASSKSKRLQSTTTSAKNKKLHELQKFLNESRNNLHDYNWLLLARKIFKQNCRINFKESIFADLVQQIRLTLHNNKSHFTWPDNEQNFTDLFPEDIVGIMIIVSFGKNNKLLQHTNQHEDTLSLLLKQVYSYLNINRDKFEEFDWFVGLIFLICGGHLERSKIVLQCIAQLPVGPYIWPTLASRLGQLENFDYSIHFDHSLNLLIDDLEIFKPALQQAGISWNFIVHNWMSQCFFNILEWNEICNYLVVSILFPPEYILFFIVCCAQHLEAKFLHTITNNDISSYLNVLQLHGFYFADYFNSLDQLSKQYKNILSKY